jgi:hypothetical protein
MPDWQTWALPTFQRPSGLSRVSPGKVPREALQRQRRVGEGRHREIVLTQQKVPLKFLSAQLQGGRGETERPDQDLNANKPGTPPPSFQPPPQHLVTASVTSDPHSWELMGGGGGAEQRLRSKAVRLKVRAGGDPGWLDCAIVATGRHGWNLRHREDMIHLARSSLPGPRCPLCHADWLSGSDLRQQCGYWGTWVASKASGRA